MMFVVHNITNQRVALQLYSAQAAQAGTPNWQARRFVRRNMSHVVVDPHRTVDLMKYGYTERELLAQPELLEFLRAGWLRRVKNEGGGYAENQFEVQAKLAPVMEAAPVVELVKFEPVAEAKPEPVKLEPVKPEAEAVPEPEPEPVKLESAEVKPDVRVPFRPKKR